MADYPEDEIDLGTCSRPGLRFALFAVLLSVYLISGILPVSTYTTSDGQSEYLLGHHAFLSGFMSPPRRSPLSERPQIWGLLANIFFWVGMAALFRGHYLVVAIGGLIATGFAFACVGIGPDCLRPCEPQDVFPFFGSGLRPWMKLPRAEGPMLIGPYVWLLTLASLGTVGVMGLIKPKASASLTPV